jgi:hypothetical protein
MVGKKFGPIAEDSHTTGPLGHPLGRVSTGKRGCRRFFYIGYSGCSGDFFKAAFDPITSFFGSRRNARSLVFWRLTRDGRRVIFHQMKADPERLAHLRDGHSGDRKKFR